MVSQLVLYLYNLLNSSSMSKEEFQDNTQKFFLKNKTNIFISTCLCYSTFLFLICDPIYCIFVLVTFGNLIIICQILEYFQFPLIQVTIVITVVVKIFFASSDPIFFSYAKDLFVLLFIIGFICGVIYSFFSNHSYILRTRILIDSCKDYRKTELNIRDTCFTSFSGINLLIPFLGTLVGFLKFIFNMNIFEFYDTLNYEEQTLASLLFLTLMFCIIVSSLVDKLILNVFHPVNGRSFARFLSNLEKNIRLLGGLAGFVFTFDMFALSCYAPSYVPCLDAYRIFWLGYTWRIPSDVLLVNKYKSLTNGLTPPLLPKSYAVDTNTTTLRVECLKALDAYHREAVLDCLERNSIEESVLLTESFTVFYKEFVEKMHSGAIRPVSPFFKDGNIYVEKSDSIK